MRDTMDNNEPNIEDEVYNSMQRLVEEETTVARAYVDSHKNSSNTDRRSVANRNGRLDGTTKQIPKVEKRSIDISDMNTRDIPSRDEINLAMNKRSPVRDTFEDTLFGNAENDDFNSSRRDGSSRRNSHSSSGNRKMHGTTGSNGGASRRIQSHKSNDNNRKLVVISVVAAVVVLAAIVIGVALMVNADKKNSFTYNYDKGMELYNANNYSEAKAFLEKAIEDKTAANNVDLRMALYKIYKSENNNSKAVSILENVLDIKDDNEEAIKALAEYYAKDNNKDKLKKIVDRYKGTAKEVCIKQYLVLKPETSLQTGTYGDDIEIELSSDASNKIYYTEDGSNPSEKSKVYSDSITIKEGKTTIKAIAINSYGLVSEISEFNYIIAYGKPSDPAVTPDSGKYQTGKLITVNNIADGTKVYYTTDGSVPDEASTRYESPFEMPAGKKTFSFIAIDSHNQKSSVVKRDYEIVVEKENDYNESLEILKKALIAKGIVKSDGVTTPDGAKVDYIYQMKTTADGIEMYVVRFDIRKNGRTNTVCYYGVGIKDGVVYKVGMVDNAYYILQE